MVTVEEGGEVPAGVRDGRSMRELSGVSSSSRTPRRVDKTQFSLVAGVSRRLASVPGSFSTEFQAGCVVVPATSRRMLS